MIDSVTELSDLYNPEPVEGRNVEQPALQSALRQAQDDNLGVQ